jgi:hypothetical protein
MEKTFEFVKYPFMKNILPGDPDGYDIIPDITMHSLRQYIIEGQCCGDFLGSLLKGEGFRAVCHADDGNERAFAALTKFIARNAPSCCFGSPIVYDTWCAMGGLRNYNEFRLAVDGDRCELSHDTIARLQHLYAGATNRKEEHAKLYRGYVSGLRIADDKSQRT